MGQRRVALASADMNPYDSEVLSAIHEIWKEDEHELLEQSQVAAKMRESDTERLDSSLAGLAAGGHIEPADLPPLESARIPAFRVRPLDHQLTTSLLAED
jgi:hypothetical protein